MMSRQPQQLAATSKRTLRRAKDELGVIVFKETGVAHGRWRWKLPR